MTTPSDTLIRDEKTGALVSIDRQGLTQRRQQIESAKRIEALENAVNSIENKLDTILKHLSR